MVVMQEVYIRPSQTDMDGSLAMKTSRRLGDESLRTAASHKPTFVAPGEPAVINISTTFAVRWVGDLYLAVISVLGNGWY